MHKAGIGFTSKEVCAVTGLTHRQLNYWRTTGLIAPSSSTPGGHGRYSFTDLVALRTAKQLLDARVSLRRIRQSIRSLQRLLPTLTQPLSELSIVATGDVVLVFHEGSAFEAITGQEWILPLAALQRQMAKFGIAPDENPPQQGELFAESGHGTRRRTRGKSQNSMVRQRKQAASA